MTEYRIPLNRGCTLVDQDVYERVKQFNWYNAAGYAARSVGSLAMHRLVFLHRVVLPVAQVDHINGDTLDNRRQNLRAATTTQNAMNKRKQRTAASSQYKGVSFMRRRNDYQARIRVRGRLLHLGYFQSEVEAAKKYDDAARKYFGEFARPNFPTLETL